ncbi:QacE family quaternary ammonium compound efflux SMR transporter [Massilia arenosa]|uniref:Guanidinium exporter n=1 Tax=Zemynaea arenosa TaxID=2561931 RepID=A0A4Y9SGT7_9BURK|nr:SMR family transporter [Massilia arenosa]TFW19487.1 QacE family quaternary ammonium compound efflux SMR transporter [Massilia arenosa]
MSSGAAWALLLAASLAEVVMASALKASAGWTRVGPSVAGIIAAAVSVLLLTLALRRLPVGVGYAVWTALGTAGVLAVGVAAYGEALTGWKMFYVALILAGVLGLRLQITA